MRYRISIIVTLALLCSGCVSDAQRAYQRAEKLDTPEAWQAVLSLPEEETLTASAKQRYAEHAERAWAAVDTTDRAAVEGYIDRFLPTQQRDEALLTRVQLLQSDAKAERNLPALLDFRDEIDSHIALDAFADQGAAQVKIAAAKQQLDALILHSAGQDILGFGLESLVLFGPNATETAAESVATTDTQRVQDILSYFEISSALVSPYSLTIRSSTSASPKSSATQTAANGAANLSLSLNHRDRAIYETHYVPNTAHSQRSLSGNQQSPVGSRQMTSGVCFMTLTLALRLFDEGYAVPRLLDYQADDPSRRRVSPCNARFAALAVAPGEQKTILQQLEIERRNASEQLSEGERDRRIQAIDQMTSALKR